MSKMVAHRAWPAPTDRGSGIICDQTIALDGAQTKRNDPEHLRRVRFRDPAPGKTLLFITNNFTLTARSMAMKGQQAAEGKARRSFIRSMKWTRPAGRGGKGLCSRFGGCAVAPHAIWIAWGPRGRAAGLASGGLRCASNPGLSPSQGG